MLYFHSSFHLMSISGRFILFILLLSDNGIELTASENVDMTTCDGNITYGTVIVVKYSEMKSNCECQIKPHFVGHIKFASNLIRFACYTEIKIFETDKQDEVLRLPCGQRTSGVFFVTNESVLLMRSEYVNSTLGPFYQQVTIFEDKTFNSTISVICGEAFSTQKTTIRINAADYTKFKITVSSEILAKDTQIESRNSSPTSKCSSTNSIISGFSGTAVGVLLTVIISIVIRHMRKTKQPPTTAGPNLDPNTGQPNNDTYEEPQDNPQYQSYRPVDNDHHIYVPLQN